MVNSMTGFGRASKQIGKCTITTELRCVNHRYFDCTVKMSRLYSFLEENVKKRVKEKVSRGQLDVFIQLEYAEDENVVISLNEPVLEGYLDALGRLSDRYNIAHEIRLMELAKLPDVFKVVKKQLDTDQLTADVMTVLDEALAEFSAMRRLEGSRLVEEISARTDKIEEIIAKLELRSPECVAEYRAKLYERLTEVLTGVDIDQSRILTEAAIFADRTAVHEEFVRLKSHISQLRKILSEGQAIGRKLDFMMQEINREANTIGSKANDFDMTSLVVDLKAELEKIREQLQNIE